ncbi:hypothetical protein N9192_02205 [Akkermansiaceae bacterium]|nr:hypothetical protein [Akkermansiaceae bacterium]
MNPFERLGLEYRLTFPEEGLELRFQEIAKTTHPDAGGSEADFAWCRSAYEELKSPGRRLKAAIKTLEIDGGERGSIPPEVVDHFGGVAEALEAVERFLNERSRARSGLARALQDSKVPELKAGLELIQKDLALLEESFLSEFESFDHAGWCESAEKMGEVSRGLAFLEKWQGQIRAAMGNLFEALLGGAS